MDKRQNNSDQEDEVDNATNFPKPAPRRKLFTSTIYNYPHESSPCSSSWSGIDRTEASPDKDDSAYHTYHHHHGRPTSSASFSAASSDRFPSSDSLRSSSPFLTSKPVHSHLIRIQLGGDEKKVSTHEWYSEFQNQSHHHRAYANSPIVSSPLSNRSANTSSSEIEYDSHIALKRGNLHYNFRCYLIFEFLLNVTKI